MAPAYRWHCCFAQADIADSEGALDECGEHFDCSGVIPGGVEVLGLEKKSSSMLTGGAA